MSSVMEVSIVVNTLVDYDTRRTILYDFPGVMKNHVSVLKFWS